MMQSRTTQQVKPAKWQNLVIIFILLFMFISALPNLYTDKVNIHLINNTHSQQVSPHGTSAQGISLQGISPQDLNSLFIEHNFYVDEIRTSTASTLITLANKSDQQAIESLLKKEFGDDYLIESTIENTAPTWLKSLGGQPIKLGLDLSGGVLFVLDVDTDRALSDKLKGTILEIRSLAVESRTRIRKISQPNKHSIMIDFGQTYVGAKQNTKQQGKAELLSKIKKNYVELTQEKVNGNQVVLTYSPEEQSKFRQETMQQTLKTMRGRIEELGITEAVTQKQGKNRIRIELPGVHDPEAAKRIIGATATLDFYQMADNSNTVGIIQMRDDSGRKLTMNAQVVFSGSHIKNAKSGKDEMGMPLVNLTLDSVGGKKMSLFSKKNIGKPMVTVFSEFYRNAKDEMVKKSKVINVATIQQHLGSQFSITNMSSPQAAQELALLLRAGSLTAPVTIVKQRSIEATLGEDNIEHGIKALTIGISFTLLFMAFWYRSLGVIANAALALNLVSLLGLMSLLPGVVLTLPGIAGLVLTVGMAVDTNVLIFERIKDELKRGRQVLSAIESGYKSAFSTILDANITTLITGIILYSIGYGPVKGFAIILCLGILTSMFTGVFVSKILTNLIIRENKTQLLGVKL
ncbi:protein translocase subunit SecD [Colwellia psychrerythraea]|uniref:Protein translocase subunit SecD n=1 Tax=Colwellia psychrerythraea TaxID=28229 RepID=A0A099L362_COLPS|nr:protein translocase subunit SecD [Colwellia psychrerythraea]KGJ96885.1 SecD export membrane protein [Colwellia psychrerythraea]